MAEKRYISFAMKKLDRRIVRTRQALASALITLALERGYENLTIREVTKFAGVGYRTFYRHYLNLDELLVQILTTAFQEAKKRGLQTETSDGDALEFYTFVSEHPDVLRVYVNLPWTHPARQVILNDAAQFMLAHYALQNTTSVPLYVVIDHWLVATNNLIAWYLDHINDYTPEQAADIHVDLVSKVISRLTRALRDE